MEKNFIKENNDLLKEIHTEVHKDRRSKSVEILTTIILSLAAIGSAWCAYQSTLWDGVQSFKLTDEIITSREISELNIKAGQIRSIDGIMFVKFVESFNNKDTALMNFYMERFNPVLKKSIVEWVDTKPLINKDAPKTPFEMSSYAIEPEIMVEPLKIKSAEFKTEAEDANRHSDKYVLLTVMFASVLFFAGISGTLSSHKPQILSFLISVFLLFGTVIVLFGMPICNQ
ncbi:MAG: hypothetical protein WAT71_15690 [Ignavibacteria bacterium]